MIELAEGVEGYVAARDIAEERVEDASQRLKVGDTIEAKFTGMDRKGRSLQLSIKAKDEAETAETLAEYNKSSADASSGTTKLGALLREHWEAIRDEARAVALVGNAAPSLATISPDHRAIAEVNKWRSFFLWGYGYPIHDNLARCPRTAQVVASIPGLNSAFFSILAPGTHIPDHRGVTKGLITCHLGLIVPRDGDVRMRVHDRIVRWAEGETLVFDDTYQHEVWNETNGVRLGGTAPTGPAGRAPALPFPPAPEPLRRKGCASLGNCEASVARTRPP